MRSKLLVIIATKDKEKALSGLMYARNAWGGAWFDDVKVVFFGPSEKLMVNDEEVEEAVKNIKVVGEIFACKAISNRENISEEIEKLGVTVMGVGSVISNFIKDGYVPMVW